MGSIIDLASKIYKLPSSNPTMIKPLVKPYSVPNVLQVIDLVGLDKINYPIYKGFLLLSRISNLKIYTEYCPLSSFSSVAEANK